MAVGREQAVAMGGVAPVYAEDRRWWLQRRRRGHYLPRSVSVSVCDCVYRITRSEVP